jgi:hypothetical protein
MINSGDFYNITKNSFLSTDRIAIELSRMYHILVGFALCFLLNFSFFFFFSCIIILSFFFFECTTSTYLILFFFLAEMPDIIATNNYWNTRNTSIIDDMIRDVNDNQRIVGRLIYNPFLLQPDPSSPKVPGFPGIKRFPPVLLNLLILLLDRVRPST